MDTTTASVVTPPPAAGIGHFIAQSDAVGHTLLVLLVGMSIASWAIIVAKGVAQALRARPSRAILDLFWNASTLDEVRADKIDFSIDAPAPAAARDPPAGRRGRSLPGRGRDAGGCLARRPGQDRLRQPACAGPLTGP